MGLPLSDITVLDLTRILSGPYATMALGDFGARIIKVESPQGDDTRAWGPPFMGDDAAYFYAINRNKESVVLNLKDPADRRVFEKMVRKADVVVENFRPGAMERLGLGFDRLSAINPGIILCSISGFGQTGPKRALPGFDQIAQGMSGLMSVTGEPDGKPNRAGFSVADLSAAMWALSGILLALRYRDREGRGQWVDVSLLDSLISFQTFQAQNYFASGKDPAPKGSAHPNLVPYQVFKAKDGYFNVAVGNDSLWQALCQALQLNEMADDARFTKNSDRFAHRHELLPMLEKIFESYTIREVLDRLNGHGVPAGPIYKLSQVFEDEQVKARDMLFEMSRPDVGVIKQLGVPVKLSESPGHPRTPPPRLGQDTDRVKREFSPDSGSAHHHPNE